MRRFWEKNFIALISLYNSYLIVPKENLPLYFLAAIILSFGLDLFHNKSLRVALYILFFLLSVLNPSLIFYLPLIMYNIFDDFGTYALFALPLSLIKFSLPNLLTAITSLYLVSMTRAYNQLWVENKKVRDELKEDSLYLQKYNEQLEIDKEKNIQIAILTERNRIARQLHDSIGHGISSSILQIEALKILCKGGTILEKLDKLQNTLKSGMEDIRVSIHNLYRESLNLKSEITKLQDELTKIDMELLYKVQRDLEYELKFDILTVVREGITNCVKHSNARTLKVSIVEQPQFYTIIIRDDGSEFDEKSYKLSKGMGLMSIKEIAYKYKGHVNYSFDNGFKIHLTLMKG